MWRKALIALMLVMILPIIGCSNKDVIKHKYVFRGENEFWIAEYNVDAVETFIETDGFTEYESYADRVLTMTYRKELSELPPVKKLVISYKGSVSGGEYTEEFSEDTPFKKTYVLASRSNGAIAYKEDVIEVNIIMDGNVQTIKLKK